VSVELNKYNLPCAIEQVKSRPETLPRTGSLFLSAALQRMRAPSQHARVGPTTPKRARRGAQRSRGIDRLQDPVAVLALAGR